MRCCWTALVALAFLDVTGPASGQEQAQEAVKKFTYKKTKQGDLAIHVHLPPGWKKEDRRPVIVFFFGGGWENGTIKAFEPQAEYLAGRGIVAARADYRVKSRHGVTPRECVEDAKSAVRWLRQNAPKLGVDPDRIVAAGGSAGGHIAACTALAPGLEPEGEDRKISSKPNALVLFNPVLRFGPQMLKRIGNDEALGKAMSPTLHLRTDSPPTLLFYGTDDWLFQQGEEFMRRSKELGHRARLFTADGQPHGYFNRSPWREKTLQQTDEFLASLGYLKGKPTIKVPESPRNPQARQALPRPTHRNVK
jgi:acetyl esterase/lipase